MENILLVKGVSQYDAMRTYIDELAEAFRKLGYNTLIVDTCKEGFAQDLEVARMMNFKFCMNFNAIGLEENVDYYSQNAVNCTYLCDHPATHNVRIANADANDLVLVCDDNFRKYIEQYFPNIKKCEFVPLSGSFVNEDIPYEERILDVVFTGSYADPIAKKQEIFASVEESMHPLVEKVMELIIKNPDDTIEVCVRKMLAFFQMEEGMTEEVFCGLVNGFMSVDAYARLYYRDKILRAIVEAGIHIYVYGNGWEKFDLCNRPNFHVEKGDAYLAQKAVANAKISLNIMPWFKAGFQERIASAMLSGTVALTDSSEYIDKTFGDGEDLVLYSLKEIENIPNIIKDLLTDTEGAKRIADTGKMKAQKEHMWFHRAEKIIQLVNEFQGVEETMENKTEGKELELTGIKLDRDTLFSDCTIEIGKIKKRCWQIRKFAYFTFEDVYKLQKETKRVIHGLKDYDKEVDIDTFVFANSLDEMKKMFPNASFAGAMLENYLQNIFGQILNVEYNSVCNKLDDCMQKNKKIEEEKQAMILNHVYRNYAASKDENMQKIIRRIVDQRYVDTYNYDYVTKYTEISYEDLKFVKYDESCGMLYVNHKGKRLYYPYEYTSENVLFSYYFALLEQDPESPHCYLSDDFAPKEGDVVIDAGVAEGNFSIEIVDKVSKLYLVECDPKWIPPLKKTFEPYGDKVVIVEKFLGSVDDEEGITIDTLVGNEQVNFIKMDIEGAEMDALCGACSTLYNRQDIKIVVCAYHRKGDEAKIKAILEKFGMEISTTEGYMFYKDDLDSLLDGELRRGLVRGIKR